jgi:hypothetical protein
MQPRSHWSASPFTRVFTSRLHYVTRKNSSALARGANSTPGRPTCQRKRFRPSPSHGCLRSGVSTWSGLSRRLLAASPTCSSCWISSPNGLRQNRSSSPTPKKLSSFLLTSSTGLVCPTPSSRTMGPTSRTSSSWILLRGMGSRSTGR